MGAAAAGALGCQDDGSGCGSSTPFKQCIAPQEIELPDTSKQIGDDRSPDHSLAWGFGEMQGWRESMEDAHIAIGSLGQTAQEGSKGWDSTALFAVFDGHGGGQVARFCERHMPEAIAECPSEDYEHALNVAFHRMDEMLEDPGYLRELRSFGNDPPGARRRLSKWSASPETIGCTAIVTCISPDAIVIANAGDSRAVLCRSGRTVDLSQDHKPAAPEEISRIHAAGGWVEEEIYGSFGEIVVHRVNGDLSLSRAIGDLEYKKNAHLPPSEQIISVAPDLGTVARQADDEFVILACDGIWDVVSSAQAVEFVRARLGPRHSWSNRLASGELVVSSVACQLMDFCFSPDLEQSSGLGGDNMTVVIVLFLPQQAQPSSPFIVPVTKGRPSIVRAVTTLAPPPPSYVPPHNGYVRTMTTPRYISYAPPRA